MPSLMGAHEGDLFQLLSVLTASGFDAAYPELKLGDYLTPAGRRAIETVRGTCIIRSFASSLLWPHRSAEFVKPNLVEVPAWRARLAENSLGGLAPAAPILLGNAAQDEIVPVQQARDLYQQWRALGANVRYVETPVGEHAIGLVAFSGSALAFLADRFSRSSWQ